MFLNRGLKKGVKMTTMKQSSTNYQNENFVNVNEVHNNTDSMTLTGFNQEGGRVTGNIEKLVVESKRRI
ncbi:hypothetical protein HMPREF9015_01490 [Leptotrichia wadei F0279]|uniref:Uncharacterized protein n=2 Tax=Leptotrichia wadei TaxID=157687 RepID=U2PZE5_LEPWF|nr:hypothetical protein HMPREF9015_01490 [Leptotrichia wadei F0279]